MMAPALLSPMPSTIDITPLNRATLYILDELHPEAVQHAQHIFNVILPSEPESRHWKENAEYIVVRTATITEADIMATKKLRAIGKQGVGLDRIDTEACKRRGIEVFNTPGVNANAVAELVLALTMSVAREIGSIQVRQSRGERVPKEVCSGQTLSGKTLGLIGMGNIGKSVARIFQGAFSARVIAYDPFLPADSWPDLKHTRTQSPGEVIAAADVLSIHVPLTATTQDMITYKDMTAMKPGAIIINAARGGIVNEDDLCRALSDGTIWGAGIDCHIEEPPTKERYGRLWAHPRVVSTPHIGAATSDTQLLSAKAAIDKVFQHLELERKYLK